MAHPKIPRFMIRFHNKSDDDQINFTNFCTWMNANVREWYARDTIVSEAGTNLGAKAYDCSYKVIYVNDPSLITQIRLTFDFVLPFKTHKKFIHPGFAKMHSEPNTIFNVELTCEI